MHGAGDRQHPLQLLCHGRPAPHPAAAQLVDQRRVGSQLLDDPREIESIEGLEDGSDGSVRGGGHGWFQDNLGRIPPIPASGQAYWVLPLEVAS